MNVTMPAFNPAMSTPKDRQWGSAGDTENVRPEPNPRQAEQTPPTAGPDTIRSSTVATQEPAMVGRDQHALANEARLQVAREGNEAPQGFTGELAALRQLAADQQTPKGQFNDPLAGQQVPNNVTAQQPGAEQTTLQRQQALQRAVGDMTTPQTQSQRILNEQV
ncbi:MAG: hypothetical protein ACLFRJ_07800 [Ectothiorhodospira sp.]